MDSGWLLRRVLDLRKYRGMLSCERRFRKLAKRVGRISHRAAFHALWRNPPISSAGRRNTLRYCALQPRSPRRFRIRIDHRAGLVFGRPQDRLLRPIAELIDIARLHVLKLGEHGARLGPFPVLAERDLARDGAKARRMD